MKKQDGFTFIEILTTVSIIILIILSVFFSYRNFEKNTELETVSQKIVAVIKLAQTKTIASENSSSYGVHFENDRYILFKGSEYQEESDDNIIYELPNRLEINNINLTNGENNILFQRINGQASKNGFINLGMIYEPNSSTTINIHPSGQIELNSSLDACCNTNRVIDSRHIHFDLGWSIQPSITLTLYFQDIPETTININMADYFNIGKTEFNWSEVLEINGENQELHIHTHFLDGINTTLCIHRDGSKNSKPLQISIDDQSIVSYTADGEAFVGFSGGIMEIQ